jgi:hypothetical protein
MERPEFMDADQPKEKSAPIRFIRVIRVLLTAGIKWRAHIRNRKRI